MSESSSKAKDNIKKPQKLETFQDDIKTQEQLEDELGQGVEKVPLLTPKPELKTITLDLSGARDIDAITQEINKLPEPSAAKKSTEKYDEWKKVANKIWVIKQAAEDSFIIKCRIGKKEKDGRYIWERNEDGSIKTEDKKFFYSPVTRQDKQSHLQLLEEKESANYDLIVETEHINKIIKNPNEDESVKYLEKKTWIKVSREYADKMHTYYYGLFKSYYNAAEEDLDRISLDDIIAYVDVALYKEGIRSPQ